MAEAYCWTSVSMAEAYCLNISYCKGRFLALRHLNSSTNTAWTTRGWYGGDKVLTMLPQNSTPVAVAYGNRHFDRPR